MSDSVDQSIETINKVIKLCGNYKEAKMGR